MSIKVICPNGHGMQVKNEFAGKSASARNARLASRYPYPHRNRSRKTICSKSWGCRGRCLARLPPANRRPNRKPIGASARIAEPEPKKPPLPSIAGQTPEPKKEPPLRRQKVCPKCCEILSVSYSDCPHCHTPLSQWTFPLPDDKAAKDRGRAACHYLGLRKQGEVLVIRFGEHRILDELTVKKFADELSTWPIGPIATTSS